MGSIAPPMGDGVRASRVSATGRGLRCARVATGAGHVASSMPHQQRKAADMMRSRRYRVVVAAVVAAMALMVGAGAAQAAFPNFARVHLEECRNGRHLPRHPEPQREPQHKGLQRSAARIARDSRQDHSERNVDAAVRPARRHDRLLRQSGVGSGRSPRHRMDPGDQRPSDHRACRLAVGDQTRHRHVQPESADQGSPRQPAARHGLPHRHEQQAGRAQPDHRDDEPAAAEQTDIRQRLGEPSIIRATSGRSATSTSKTRSRCRARPNAASASVSSTRS